MPAFPRHLRRWVLLTVGLVCSSRPAHAVTITGVVRSNTGVAVANADVDFLDQCTGDNIFLASDHTAADGTFRISVPSGTYDAHFVPPAGSTRVAGDRQDLVLNGNTNLGTITLSPGRLVSGTVLTPALAAAANVDLKFVNAVLSQRVFLTKTVTDALGRWSVRVPSGTWDIDFRPAAGSALADVERLGLVVDAADIAGLSNTLRSGVTITGVVRDRNSNPLKGVDLSLFDQCTGERIATAHDNTDATGAFSVVAPPGSYTVDIDPPACKLVEATRVPDLVIVANTNLGTFTLRDAVTVSGTIRNPDSTPMVNAKLLFFDVSGATAPRQATTRDHTSATGAFSIAVPPSTYDINVEPPVGSNALVLHLDNRTVNGNTSLGTFTATAGAAVTGRLLGPGDTPQLNVNINVLDQATRVSQRIAQDASDASGNFRVVLAPGTYDFQYVPALCGGLAPASQDSVRILTATALPNVDLVTGVHLTGVVTDTFDVVAPNVDIDLFQPGGANKLFTPGAGSDATGAFDLFVAPGAYDLRFLPPAGSRLRPRELLNTIAATSRVLPAVLLERGWLVSGFVRDAATLQPMPGVRVEVLPAHQHAPLWTPHNDTDALGHFSFPVDDGSWDLHFIPPPGSPALDAWRQGVVVSADVALSDQRLGRPSAGIAPPGSTGLELAAPRPNPARGTVRFTFVASRGDAELSIWDVSGRRVVTLWHGRASGAMTLTWDGRSAGGVLAAPGLYLARLTDTLGEIRLHHVTLLK